MHSRTNVKRQILTVNGLLDMSIPYFGNHPKRPKDYDQMEACKNTIWLYDHLQTYLDDNEIWSIDISPSKNALPTDLLRLIPAATSLISSILIPKECRKGVRAKTCFALESGDGTITTDHLHGVLLVKPETDLPKKIKRVKAKLKTMRLIPDKSESVKISKILSSDNLTSKSGMIRLLHHFHYMSKQTNRQRDPLAFYKE